MSETSELLAKIREEKPLIHHITNWVTIYDCANVVRAIGALPVMAHAKEEAADMTRMASALVLNIGTLTTELVESMKLAGKSANEKGIPVVLDVVGVGATKLREDKANEILNEVRVDIIKGNVSEIAKLAGEDVKTRGVEASQVESDLIEIAVRLALEKKATVVVTGKEDIVTDGKVLYICKNGHDMLGKFVGTGCMVASVIGCFAAVEKNYAKAAASALVVFGIAGELASRLGSGPGSYKSAFYDELFNLDESDIDEMKRLEEKRITKKEKEEKTKEELKQEIKKEEKTIEKLEKIEEKKKKKIKKLEQEKEEIEKEIEKQEEAILKEEEKIEEEIKEKAEEIEKEEDVVKKLEKEEGQLEKKEELLSDEIKKEEVAIENIEKEQEKAEERKEEKEKELKKEEDSKDETKDR